MSTLIEKTISMAASVNRTTDANIREYSVISEIGRSSVGSESGEQLFRLFTPVKEQKGRKLNSIYGHSFNPCKDTLMDYPTIVQHRLSKIGSAPWTDYNRLISLHISRCPLQCWHCYVEECLRANCKLCKLRGDLCKGERRKELQIKEKWLSASEIVDKFIEQRNRDKSVGISANILRITGGEPFLASQLLLVLLCQLR